MILTIWKKTEHDRNCLIKIDDSVWGSLSEKALRTLFHYHTGSFDITESEAAFLQDELLRASWGKLQDWLARQDHPAAECRLYLKRFSFHPSIIDKCIREGLERNFINDKRYCRLLIESLIQRQKSPQQIKTKLIEKKLPASLWEPLLQEIYQPADKQSALLEQAQKIYLRYKDLESRACYEKCLTSLYRKGFDLDDARDVVAGLVFRK